MITIGGLIVVVLIMGLLWEVMRRFSCLNCLFGIVFIAIGLILLVGIGILQWNAG